MWWTLGLPSKKCTMRKTGWTSWWWHRFRRHRRGSVPVVLGESDPQAGWVEVLRGLSAGDRLLVPERVAQVREGQRVRLGEVETPWLPPYAR